MNKGNKLSDQCRRVVEYITMHNSITALEAMNDLGIARLAARIHELRENHGFDILDQPVKMKNRWGKPVKISRYYLDPCSFGPNGKLSEVGTESKERKYVEAVQTNLF